MPNPVAEGGQSRLGFFASLLSFVLVAGAGHLYGEGQEAFADAIQVRTEKYVAVIHPDADVLDGRTDIVIVVRPRLKKDVDGVDADQVTSEQWETYFSWVDLVLDPDGAPLEDIATPVDTDVIQDLFSEGEESYLPGAAGHSLGGALADFAASDAGRFEEAVGEISTFQAPGIEVGGENGPFEGGTASGVEVRFHSTNSDVVHRAGKERLQGDHYEMPQGQAEESDKLQSSYLFFFIEAAEAEEK